MSFDRPSLATLISRDQADTAARLAGADPTLRRSLVGVLSSVRAAAVHGLYGYLDWLALQLMPDTAETEHLERWASIWGLARQAATRATGLATFTGASGAAIPAETIVLRSDGTVYVTDEEALLVDGIANVAITASQAGTVGNAGAGVLLALESPISGVESKATAASGLTGGADDETDAALRARLLLRIRTPAKGGSADDYARWVLDHVPGATRAWVAPQELGAGTVTVRFCMDGAYADGIPAAGDVAAAQAILETLRPVTAEVYVAAPISRPLGLSIRLTPDLASVRAAVTAELADMLRDEATPGGTILVSHIREAISLATGETDHVLLSPTTNVECATGELAVVGAITWSE
ncbi:Uncharacterized phage protein gp47/JayE [Humidesulfovibrio mexicanus]|uniref:Uncharacterized phage protein gp47/JayE n=1 Tax=Humidesulfovibrio mexicanus TaxID=147047 RepID=A0A239BBW6_9BACT|nr:baseplate J/gp47 family protein [Humidesulfovibrio mexicanus]SNS05436.1 Uncharacterized phage protein gp47/JayE [Humidesulfovibrio mexicanus]